MSDQPTGLRFDIYERLQLSESAAGIKELDEMELVPRIQVLSQGEQAVLKGNLLLTGTYVSEDEEGGAQTLQHSIPVEITLPMNRIQALEHISVQIENFDVDLLSSRSLNITGVLSLHGIELTSAVTEEWRNSEETVFVHQAEEGGGYSEADGTREEPPDEPQYREANADDADEPAGERPTEAAAPSANEAGEIGDSGDETGPTAEEETWETILPEETKEPKIAFGSKKAYQDEEASENWKSLLRKPQIPVQEETVQPFAEEIREDAAETTVPEPEAKRPPGDSDALEWKKLFLSTAQDDRKFRKLRMCIVQKDETIQSIAERYQLNPREIILYNRLGEQELMEGQVIYIPK